MKSFGTFKPVSKITLKSYSQEDFKQLFIWIYSSATQKYKEDKVRKDKAYYESVQSSFNDLLRVFSSKRKLEYNNSTDSWVQERYTSTIIWWKWENLEIDEKEVESFKEKLKNGHQNKEEFLAITKEFVEYMNLKMPKEYSYLGKHWTTEPTKEEMVAVKTESDNKMNEYKIREARQKDLKQRLEDHQVDKAKWEFVYIFIGEDKKITESKYWDLDLLEDSIKKWLHYCDREHSERDGPTRNGSYSHWIVGKYYVIPVPDVKKDKYTKFDAWDLKKIVQLLEKDWYTCNFKPSSWSYWSRSYDLEATGADWKKHRFAHNSARKSFVTGYLPKHLDCDNFQIIWHWIDTSWNVIAGAKKTITTTSNPVWTVWTVWVTPTTVSAEFSIVRNTAKNWIELHFNTKPTRETIDKLKSNWYRWWFANKCWYRKDRWEIDEEVVNKLK